MTKNITEIEILKNIIRSSDKIINFVPTMGNIHLGHESLIKLAVKKSQISIVSIFVNPLQFSEKEDYVNYPKTYQDDKQKIDNLGADYLFLPDQSFIDDIKGSPFHSFGELTRIMCGKDRPGHFHGVALIVSKLLKMIKPDYIYLGEKDYQQTIVIKELIAKLSMKTKIKTHQIVREENGLALSSRNSRLNHENKLIAVEIFKVLNAINNEIQENFFLLSRLEYFKEFLINVGFEKVNYLEIRKDDNLSLVDDQFSFCRLFISAQINGIRLIDNIFLGKIKKSDQRIINF